MMKAHSIIAIACVAAGLSACASTGAITPAGKDTFVIAAVARGGMSWSEVKALALRDASKFCDARKLNFVPLRIATSGVRGFSPQEASLTFKCVSETDPDWKNPPALQEGRA